jgi:hypothetical protein
MRLLLVMIVLLLTGPAHALDERCWEEVSPQGEIKHCGDNRTPDPRHTQAAQKPKPHVTQRRVAPSNAAPSYKVYPSWQPVPFQEAH